MGQSKDKPRPPWARMLEALPLPAAVVNAQGCCVYLNEAGAADPFLAPLRPAGLGNLGPSDDEALRCLARLQQAYREQVLQTRTPVSFEEEARDGDRRVLWLFTPMADPDGRVEDVIMMGFDVTGVCRQAAASSLNALVDHIGREIQVPLMALVGLAHSLTHELTMGPQVERAVQIDRYGQLLLRQLRSLLASVPVNHGS